MRVHWQLLGSSVWSLWRQGPAQGARDPQQALLPDHFPPSLGRPPCLLLGPQGSPKTCPPVPNQVSTFHPEAGCTATSLQLEALAHLACPTRPPAKTQAGACPLPKTAWGCTGPGPGPSRARADQAPSARRCIPVVLADDSDRGRVFRRAHVAAKPGGVLSPDQAGGCWRSGQGASPREVET